MKASAFVIAFQQRYGVTLAMHRGRLHVLGGVAPRSARMAIAAQRDSLLAYFADVEDVELRVSDPERYDLVKLESGEYAHPEGDHVIEEILLDPERRAADARERQTRRDREAYAMGALRPSLPKAQALDIRPGNHPGHSIITIHKGRRYKS